MIAPGAGLAAGVSLPPLQGPPAGGSLSIWPCSCSGAPSASGPGSWPPANFTSAATRASTEGWVANRSAKPSRGLSMHISITAELAEASSPRPSILRSAEIMASGFLVSSTEPESARYSRWRDSAKRMTMDSIHATAISAMRDDDGEPGAALALAVAAAARAAAADRSSPGRTGGRSSRRRTRSRRRSPSRSPSCARRRCGYG